MERRIDAHQRMVNKRMDEIGDLLLALNRKSDRIAVLLGDEEHPVFANGAAGDAGIFSAEGDFRSIRKSKADALREPVKKKASFGAGLNIGSRTSLTDSSALSGDGGNTRESRLPWKLTTSTPSNDAGDVEPEDDNLLSGRLEA
eukprot:2959635-Prymnesium_polylepis.1